VQLETSEAVRGEPTPTTASLPGTQRSLGEEREPREMKWQRVLYTMQNRKLSRETL
jgi:stage V sporulation protein R